MLNKVKELVFMKTILKVFVDRRRKLKNDLSICIQRYNGRFCGVFSVQRKSIADREHCLCLWTHPAVQGAARTVREVPIAGF